MNIIEKSQTSQIDNIWSEFDKLRDDNSKTIDELKSFIDSSLDKNYGKVTNIPERD